MSSTRQYSHHVSVPSDEGVRVDKAITIQKSVAEVYSFWRQFDNLPRFMRHVQSVTVKDPLHSHWAVKTVGGKVLEWDAEITTDRKNEMIGWVSLEGADIDNAGYVRFERATGGRGTVIRVALQYNPPAGKLGAALATLLGEKPETQVEEALRKFKQLVETGEIATTSEEEKRFRAMEAVEEASEDSFPASDAPAWTGTTGPVG